MGTSPTRFLGKPTLPVSKSCRAGGRYSYHQECDPGASTQRTLYESSRCGGGRPLSCARRGVHSRGWAAAVQPPPARPRPTAAHRRPSCLRLRPGRGQQCTQPPCMAAGVAKRSAPLAATARTRYVRWPWDPSRGRGKPGNQRARQSVNVNLRLLPRQPPPARWDPSRGRGGNQRARQSVHVNLRLLPRQPPPARLLAHHAARLASRTA